MHKLKLHTTHKSPAFQYLIKSIQTMPKITKQEWNTFIDKGTVTHARVQLIANKIKANQTLTVQEITMYQGASQRVEALLKGQ